MQAAGRAWGVKNSGKSEVVYVSGGDGSTSQGEFHEMLNFASLHQLPLVIAIQNNQWAISVPFADQCGADLVALGNSYSGLATYEVDGGDVSVLTQTFERAVSDARHRHIPALVIVNVVRLESHSNSDNQAKYRSEEDLSCCQAQDPLVRLEKSLLDDLGLRMR